MTCTRPTPAAPAPTRRPRISITGGAGDDTILGAGGTPSWPLRHGSTCRMRVASSSGEKEVDWRFTKLDPTFHDMVAFVSTAREAHVRFRMGDSFVASGYVHEFELGGREGSVIKEEFVARKVGHNVNKTDYVVQRGRHAADRPLTAVPLPPAVGL